MVVLSTKVEVAQQNCCLRAGDEQNDENQEQESKHVVHLMRPNAVENEEKLNEDAAKGEDATHHYTRDGFGEEGLLRYLTGDLVCSHWLLNCWFLESKVGTNKGEGYRDSKPQGQNGNQSTKGDCS